MDYRLTEWRRQREEIIQWLNENGFPQKSGSGNDEVGAEFFEQPGDIGLQNLKVAAIMDPFTLACYAPECQLLELTPAHWKEEIETFRPHMLFIESAWRGKDGLWTRKIDRYSEELEALTTHAREWKIPIVFWNKEDPRYTDTFMLAASYADVVFTTDIDCVVRYKAELGHDRVYHLHFGAQPRLHNPIEKVDREDKFCFAGAYYHKYKERSEVFDAFSDVFAERKGLAVYDRNYPNPPPEYAFPAKYQKYILGSLPPEQIDIAYKGYLYGVNMNSISQSQSMFARRVFELLASDTVVAGNFARGLKNYFGDLTISTNDVKTLEAYLDRFCADETSLRKYRLAGLRKVLSEDLYEDRLGYITEKVFGKNMKRALPGITVIADVETAGEADRIEKMFRSQSYEKKKLLLTARRGQDETVRIGSEDRDKWYAVFDARDWYGKNYLTDLALATRYTESEVIGKAAFYQNMDDGLILENAGARYTLGGAVNIRRGIVKGKLLQGKTIAEAARTGEWESTDLLSIDEFNYCADWRGESCPETEDLEISDQGLPLGEIERAAESIEAPKAEEGVLRFMGAELVGACSSKKKTVTFTESGSEMKIESTLPPKQHEYFYFTEKQFEVEPWVQDSKLAVRFRGNGDLEIICVLICYDGDQKKLEPVFPKLNIRESVTLPEGTKTIVPGIRVKGTGTAAIQDIVIGGTTDTGDNPVFLSRSEVMVLTNHYPSADNLYRNMFVHKRIASYKESGMICDVMMMNPYAKECWREFEGINVIETKGAKLLDVLESGDVKTICVHFLDREMWEMLKGYLSQIRLIIWLHGAEIQPWWRREYNFKTKSELEEGKKQSEIRMQFWNEVFETAGEHSNITFVFVSHYFANEVMSDYKITLPPEQYRIIHNLIDTEMFRYIPRDAEDRKKILTIKSFSSAVYANDLTMKGILELSKRPCFGDLEIDIYGDGNLFDKVNQPLKKFPNVHLHKTFLTAKEIAKIHKTHGVYIATTRSDTQGVSRDEAMSSGLVPIVSNCTAIPEFVDDTCGILIPAESYVEIADAIERLYNDPELFLGLSESAAKRVRNQTSKEFTIDKEIALIEGMCKGNAK